MKVRNPRVVVLTWRRCVRGIHGALINRRWEAAGFRGGTSGIRGHPRLEMLRLRVTLMLRHRVCAAIALREGAIALRIRPDRGDRANNERSRSCDTHLRHGLLLRDGLSQGFNDVDRRHRHIAASATSIAAGRLGSEVGACDAHNTHRRG